MLAEESQRENEEEEAARKKDKEEKTQKELIEREKEEADRITEKLGQKEQEGQDMENQEQNMDQDNLESVPSTSGDILTRGHLPIVELGSVPFTPLKQHEVASLDNVFFNPKRKTIVWRSEKTLKIGNQLEVTTVTEKTVVKNVEEDPEQMASIGVATA